MGKKNKNSQPKPPKDNYIFVVNAWGYESGNWNWAIIDAWFDAMCKGEGSGMRTELYFYQKTHGYLIVKLEKDTAKNIAHLFGKHHYNRFLTNCVPHDARYATIYPYNYEKWGDPAKQQWSEEYGMPMPAGRNVPLRVPYPVPEPTPDLAPVEARKWTRQVDPVTYQLLLVRYERANPSSTTAPGSGSSTGASAGASTSASAGPSGGAVDAAAEALLAALLPGPLPEELIGGSTAWNEGGKKEEDVEEEGVDVDVDLDRKSGLIVKGEEERKGLVKVDWEDVDLPPELINGSFGYVKPEPGELLVKGEEDRKFENVELPEELINGSFGYVKPEEDSKEFLSSVKMELDMKGFRLPTEDLPSGSGLERGSVSVKPEHFEDDYEDPGVKQEDQDHARRAETVRINQAEGYVKREGDEGARIKEEQSGYESGSYKRVKREHLS